jgi:hypothetical protein
VFLARLKDHVPCRQQLLHDLYSNAALHFNLQVNANLQ